MKKGSIIFLQVVITLIGIGTLTLLLWEPHLEGRNAHSTLSQIYFNDPFLAYAYIGSIAFFVALYQAFKLSGYVGKNEVFSQEAVKSLRTIKYCALIIISFVVGAEAYIWITVRGKDDIAGGVAMGLFIIFDSLVITATAAVFEKLLRQVINIKSENDLTV